MIAIFQEGPDLWRVPLDEGSAFLLHMQFLRCDVAGTTDAFVDRLRAWLTDQLPSLVDRELRQPSPELLAEAKSLAQQLGMKLPSHVAQLELVAIDFVEHARRELASRSGTMAQHEKQKR